MCDNIDLFNKCCVAILGKLYREFPVPTQITSDEAVPLVGIDNYDKQGRYVFIETVTFLNQEGYLIFESAMGSRSKDDRIFRNIRLTSKGLAALNRTPKELEHAPSIGERIAGWTGDLIKDASREAVKGAVQAFLGG